VAHSWGWEDGCLIAHWPAKILYCTGVHGRSENVHKAKVSLVVLIHLFCQLV
jgi:hypothetical protein